MIDMLTHYRDVFVVLHTISFAIGLGAATVHDVAFSHYLSKFDTEQWNALAHNICLSLIRSSLVWIVLSGAALFMINKDALLSSTLFQFKMLLVGLILVSSYLFHHQLLPKLAKSFLYDSAQTLTEKRKLRYLRRSSFAMASLSLTSWYSAASLGGLRELNLSLPILLGVYASIVALGIIASFFAEAKVAARLERSSQALLREVAAELLDKPATLRSSKSPKASGFWAAYRLNKIIKPAQTETSGRTTIN